MIAVVLQDGALSIQLLVIKTLWGGRCLSDHPHKDDSKDSQVITYGIDMSGICDHNPIVLTIGCGGNGDSAFAI